MEQSKFYQIKNITEHEYTLVGCNGSVITRPIQDVDRLASAFTIQDAKDGDVLADGNLSFIFKKIDTNKYSYAYCGISVDGGFKIESDGESGEWTWMQDIKPATKEQRELLFQKMKEAGYEWDVNKKELKKIELSCFESALFTAFSDAWQSYLQGEEVDVKQWAKEHSKELLEAVKEELKGHNPAWGEEDENRFKNLIELVKQSDEGQATKIGFIGFINRLKSLKDRCTWKPSDEQMKALADALSLANNCGEENAFDLRTLYEQLKKLREE